MKGIQMKQLSEKEKKDFVDAFEDCDVFKCPCGGQFFPVGRMRVECAKCKERRIVSWKSEEPSKKK